jgi:hypothetical protein
VRKNSSTASPSSELATLKSDHRIQNVAPFAMLRPVTADAIAVLFAAAFPSCAPTGAVVGLTKSSVEASIQVPVASDVASRLY